MRPKAPPLRDSIQWCSASPLAPRLTWHHGYLRPRCPAPKASLWRRTHLNKSYSLVRGVSKSKRRTAGQRTLSEFYLCFFPSTLPPPPALSVFLPFAGQNIILRSSNSSVWQATLIFNFKSLAARIWLGCLGCGVHPVKLAMVWHRIQRCGGQWVGWGRERGWQVSEKWTPLWAEQFWRGAWLLFFFWF